MEVKKAKGGIYALALFVTLILLLNAYCCGAAVLVRRNTTVRCNGRLDECLIEDDLGLEFLMDSYISRMLETTPDGSGIVYNTNSANSPTCPTGTSCSNGCQKKNSADRSCGHGST